MKTVSILAALSFSVSCFGACGTGSTTISGAQIAGRTHRQLIVQFRVPHANAARVDVFADAACTKEIPDTLTANAANRAGAVIDGTLSSGNSDGSFVQFPVGTLTGTRALTQSTQYWVQIKNTADNSFLTLEAGTAVMPVGNLYPEQPLPDATAWDNRAYPKFNWGNAHRNDQYTDPTTGLIVKPMTMPGDGWSQLLGVGDGTNPPPDVPVQNSGTWTNPNNAASSYSIFNYPAAPSGNYATCTGTCDIWVPLPSFAVPYSRWDTNTGSAYGWIYGLDYVVPYVWASASTGSPTMTVSLTETPTGTPYHGCSFASTLTSSKRGYRTADPDPGYTLLCTTPPIRGDIAPSTGMVTTNGTAVTWVSGMYFQATWPAGSRISINGTMYQIAAVNSATSITLMSSAGTQSSPVAYASRILGMRIQVTAGAGTLSVQAGYSFGQSFMAEVSETYASGQLQCNQNPNTIANDANGNAYSGYTLQGYICFIAQNSNPDGMYYLVIPKDQNNAPLGEVRMLGTTTTALNFTSNGVSFTSPNIYYAGPDATNPDKWYVTFPYNNRKTVLLLSAKFDSTVSGCSTLWKTWAGTGTYPAGGNNVDHGNPCITYTNLTNPTGGTPMDLVSQIKRAYATAKPGFDLGGFGIGATVYLNGYFINCLGTNGDPELEVCGTFDTSGTLTQIFDTFSTWPGRFCGVHGPVHMVGLYHHVDCNFVSNPNPGIPLYGPFTMPVSRVNLAGYGASPNWTNTTSLDNGPVNQYGCPTAAQMQSLGTPLAIANALVTMGSSGNHCVQLEITSEPCSANPDPAVIWANNTKTEAQQFPCPTNPAASMLQTLQPGDTIKNIANGPGGESFLVLTKQITSTGGVCTTGGYCTIDIWTVRGVGILPNNAASYPVYNTHANGWTAGVAPIQHWNCSSIGGDASAVTHGWLETLNTLCFSHGMENQGSSASNVNFAFGDSGTCSNYSTFNTVVNTTTAQALTPPWGPGCVFKSPEYPTFGRNTISMTSPMQFYTDGNDLANPGTRMMMAFRAINPSYGSGPETIIGLGTSGYSLSAASGTNQTYTITDPYSSGPANQKLIPLAAWAGHTMLTDYSGAGSVLPDSGYGVCRALRNGECVPGSVAGTTYVSVPSAAGINQGYADQHTINGPTVVNPSSALGQFEQVPLGIPDADGSHQRILGQSLTGVGREWQFISPKLLPTGDWMMGECVYKDGFISQVCLFQVPPYFADNVNRTGYVNVPVSTGGKSGDTVRVEFWYQEWGGVNGRAEHAFTNASPSASSPFLWSYETPSYANCSASCTVNIPAISGRLLYYSVHRKNGNDTAGPVQVFAVN